MQRITRGLHIGNIKLIKHVSHWPGTQYMKTVKVLVWEPAEGELARQLWKTHTEERRGGGDSYSQSE